MVRIGLSTNISINAQKDGMPRDYPAAVLRAGGLPLILPTVPMDHPDYDELISQMAAAADGFVFVGGPDIDPLLYYQEERLPQCGPPCAERDRVDIALIRRVLARGKPFLAICRGIQTVNVAMGGTLYQDLDSQLNLQVSHQQTDAGTHAVRVYDNTLLRSLVHTDTLRVNSRHHQAIKTLAPGLLVSAVSPDGVIEAAEFLDGRPALCVQWHPENLSRTEKEHQALFDWLIRKAGALL